MRGADELAAVFEARTLPKPEWTHEAHVVVCWVTVRDRGAADALTHLRRAIPAYNEASGTPNTDTDGYHDTITRYYVEAVGALAGEPLDVVLAHPSCSRTAPLDFWSRDRLFSVAARRGWVAPDRAPLPWAPLEPEV